MEYIKPPYDKVNNLRTLYDDYMKYKHAKTDAERNKAIKKLLEVHGMDIVKIEKTI